MKWASAIDVSERFQDAFKAVCQSVKKELGRKKADVAFLFVSFGFRKELVDLWSTLKDDIPAKLVIGAAAGGVIGPEKEIEGGFAVSLVCGVLPGVKVTPFHLHNDSFPSSDGSPRPWRDLIGVGNEKNPCFVILTDPFSLDAEKFLAGLDFAYPGSVKVGGLVSGGMAPDQNLLILNDKVLHKGAIGVALSGKVKMEPIVAQGCRPVGPVATVTEAQENVLISIDNQPPLRFLSDLYQDLNERDKELFNHSLFVGVLMDSLKKNPKAGDFLIRNIIGLDKENGLIAVGARLRTGQTIQFHLRDAETSKEDLKNVLSQSEGANEKDAGTANQKGAVLFSCLGRGKGLYGTAHHDVGELKKILGDIPVGGFFCSGEIGPVGGNAYLHGYTSSIGIIQADSPDRKKEKEK